MHIPLGYFDKTRVQYLMEESLKMKRFSHPHVLGLIGVCVDAGPAPYIVMPYMAKGSLQSYLKKQRHRLILSEEEEEEDVSFVSSCLVQICIIINIFFSIVFLLSSSNIYIHIIFLLPAD